MKDIHEIEEEEFEGVEDHNDNLHKVFDNLEEEEDYLTEKLSTL